MDVQDCGGKVHGSNQRALVFYPRQLHCVVYLVLGLFEVDISMSAGL